MSPSNDILARLVTVATKRFGPRAKAMGPEDDLFESLGIDSLQALDLLTDLEEAFDIELPDYELQGVTSGPQFYSQTE